MALSPNPSSNHSLNLSIIRRVPIVPAVLLALAIVPVVLLALSTEVQAGRKPKHTKVTAATSTKAKNLAFDFSVKANKGMQLTLDAPWSLEIKNHDGLKFKKTKFKRADMDDDIPGFRVKADSVPTKDKGSVDYKLTAFVCTSDKTQCFREVHNGKTDWTFAGK